MTDIESREVYRTSYAGLFAAHPARRPVTSVRIPLIQRDYAQGRPGRQIEEIRTSFLDALHDAVSGDPVGLEFVFGDVDSNGTLLPLDGQQRLTTLSLVLCALREAAAAAGLAELAQEVGLTTLEHQFRKGTDRYRLFPKLRDRDQLSTPMPAPAPISYASAPAIASAARRIRSSVGRSMFRLRGP